MIKDGDTIANYSICNEAVAVSIQNGSDAAPVFFLLTSVFIVLLHSLSITLSLFLSLSLSLSLSVSLCFPIFFVSSLTCISFPVLPSRYDFRFHRHHHPILTYSLLPSRSKFHFHHRHHPILSFSLFPSRSKSSFSSSSLSYNLTLSSSFTLHLLVSIVVIILYFHSLFFIHVTPPCFHRRPYPILSFVFFLYVTTHHFYRRHHPILSYSLFPSRSKSSFSSSSSSCSFYTIPRFLLPFCLRYFYLLLSSINNQSCIIPENLS
ncbi:unnamed protein product [Acanthosepion pharaonis]|uniref:Uncharacterized protein n=1 Tax=Acanthosepion pharaonis TaxID=158019 RepID=A0A812BL34_ACAPH|nr:unnamed protein product [Sepia pharaonis]